MKRKNVIMLKSREKAKYSLKVKKRGKWFYSFILFKVFSGGMAPLVPILIVNEGGTPTEIGYTSGLGSLASMIGGVIWGRLSDKLGRRKIFMSLGIFGSTISVILMSVSLSIKSLIFLNILYMFFLAATIPLPISIISREFRKYEINEAIGKFNKLGGWGWVGGLILGFALINFANPRIAILGLGALGILSGILTIKRIKEVPIHPSRFRVNGIIPSLFTFHPRKITLSTPKLRDEILRIVFISSFLFWIGSMLALTQFPVLAKEKGLDGETLYFVSISSSVTSALTYQRVANSIVGIGILNYVNGLILRSLGLAGLLFVVPLPSKTFLLASILVYSILGYSWAMISISTSSIISARSSENTRGRIFGSYNLVCSSGAIIGSLGSGYLANNIGMQGDLAIGLSLMIPAIYVNSKILKKEVQPLNFGLFERSRGKGLGL
uniref:Major facilitator superfamily (MFS) profile domain-containing protein n=1 Tax=Pyrococcus abyssi (strain GE5 / Orsay) TaxID=272844 RepID=G8ZHE7_PYRAB|nr:TPA: hypothetical protein PAB0885 [Pyrococcus abyssi GE5]